MQEDISIGYWIKRRRKTLDMTQADLANRVGYALITIAIRIAGKNDLKIT
jgi:transcriptional regulator with XRE-family HTH domain